jgi:transcriptional regulator with XRE-family HTH domain
MYTHRQSTSVHTMTQPLADVIRDAIRETGQSAFAVARAAGVSQPVLSRFLSGERGILLDTAEKLCQLLGLELRRVDEPE